MCKEKHKNKDKQKARARLLTNRITSTRRCSLLPLNVRRFISDYPQIEKKLIRNDRRPKCEIHQMCIGAQNTFLTNILHDVHITPLVMWNLRMHNSLKSFHQHLFCNNRQKAYFSSNERSLYGAYSCHAWGYKNNKRNWPKILTQWHICLKIRKLRVRNRRQDRQKPNEVAECEYWWEPGFQNMTDRHGRV